MRRENDLWGAKLLLHPSVEKSRYRRKVKFQAQVEDIIARLTGAARQLECVNLK